MNRPSERFRAGVGVVVVEPAGRVLALERRLLSGAWQLPQGGIDEGESLDDAMWRELREETGLGPDELTHAADIPLWLGYELPESARSAKTGRGQVHRWCVLRSRTDVLALPTPPQAPAFSFVPETFVLYGQPCVHNEDHN